MDFMDIQDNDNAFTKEQQQQQNVERQEKLKHWL